MDAIGLCNSGPNSGQVKRLLEDHGVDFGLAARCDRLAFDLVEALLVVKYRNVGIPAVRPRNGKLAAICRTDTVLDVEFDHAAVRQGLDRVGHQGLFVRATIRHIGDGQCE